ncbi:HlyD family secretion protein [Qingshengfaniella alkalisoli]|uniref:HlyD family secretion protein n=1 Tax=Qingshengfaniella alkalisoli TaxID=2599296 RepID=UPI00143CF7F1|nr:efflux RND transporter periplasmic adaptor subunit [Qingshengfaniella alkalisoli]
MSRKWIWVGTVAVVIVGAYLAWNKLANPGLPAEIATGNGRIEATEIDISARLAGRIDEILVEEGDAVQRGDVLVHMDVVQLTAQRRKAEAARRRAEIAIETANSQVTQTEAQKAAAEATVEEAQAVADAASARVARTERLAATSVLSQQVLDDDRASDRQAQAGLASAKASLAAAEAAIGTAKAQVVDAEAAVEAAQAEIDYVTAQIDDSTLISPRSGRIQYRIAQEGEVVSAGGRILSLVDLRDVYMTFFLPTSQAGLVNVGSEVRLAMDALPGYVLPASISFVADVAQFTPKTVETAEEREKLMFRVRARINHELLEKYIQYVKTGLPGQAYVRLDPNVEWPDFLSNVVE